MTAPCLKAQATVEWKVVILLLVSVFINYVDRGNLSVAAPVLAPELSLSPTELGLLFSSFFWTYSPLQIVAGWLVDRFHAAWVYAAGFLLWSVATVLTGLTGTFTALLAVRLLLGMSESVVYPACSQILASNFSEQQRGRANALIDVGAKAGPALGTLLGGILIARYGWRALFVGVGLASLLWLPPWRLWAPRGETSLRKREDPPGMLEILSRRDAWGTSLGLFCHGYVWYFLLTWLPSYLVIERHFSMNAMAVSGSLPYAAIALSSVTCGFASDRWISRGADPTRVRKGFVISGLLLMCLFVLPAALVANPSLAVALLTAACLSMGLFSSNVWAISQTIAGPLAAGKWTGIQNAVGNLGGVVSPVVTGLVVSRTHSFFLAFLVGAVMLVLGALSFFFLVGKVAPFSWAPKCEHAAHK